MIVVNKTLLLFFLLLSNFPDTKRRLAPPLTNRNDVGVSTPSHHNVPDSTARQHVHPSLTERFVICSLPGRTRSHLTSLSFKSSDRHSEIWRQMCIFYLFGHFVCKDLETIFLFLGSASKVPSSDVCRDNKVLSTSRCKWLQKHQIATDPEDVWCDTADEIAAVERPIANRFIGPLKSPRPLSFPPLCSRTLSHRLHMTSIQFSFSFL